MKRTSMAMLAGVGLLIPLLASAVPVTRVPLPYDLVDTLDGARFRIRVPANWNGTLLLYLPGTKAPAVPVPAEPAVAPPVVGNNDPSLEKTLLDRGYALAGSEVAAEDWQNKEEVQDTLALANYFRGRVGAPSRVILIGTSMGGFGALRLIEEFPRSFDGAIATCAPGAGFPKSWDWKLDVLIAYSAVFGWPGEWGTIAAMRPGLDFNKDVMPVVQWPKPDGSNRGQWEFVRLVSGLPAETFWSPDPLTGSSGVGMTMWFATAQRAAMEAFAGPFQQNMDHYYTLKPEEKSYLAGMGVNADALLARMNQTNVEASENGREFLERFGTVRGVLRRPLISMHTTIDGTAPVANESAYRAMVEKRGCSAHLTQAYVKAAGHCAFTSVQILAALEAMEHWLETGVAPDASFFPESKGFDNGFLPPPWPY